MSNRRLVTSVTVDGEAVEISDINPAKVHDELNNSSAPVKYITSGNRLEKEKNELESFVLDPVGLCIVYAITDTILRTYFEWLLDGDGGSAGFHWRVFVYLREALLITLKRMDESAHEASASEEKLEYVDSIQDPRHIIKAIFDSTMRYACDLLCGLLKKRVLEPAASNSRCIVKAHKFDMEQSDDSEVCAWGQLTPKINELVVWNDSFSLCCVFCGTRNPAGGNCGACSFAVDTNAVDGDIVSLGRHASDSVHGLLQELFIRGSRTCLYATYCLSNKQKTSGGKVEYISLRLNWTQWSHAYRATFPSSRHSKKGVRPGLEYAGVIDLGANHETSPGSKLFITNQCKIAKGMHPNEILSALIRPEEDGFSELCSGKYTEAMRSGGTVVYINNTPVATCSMSACTACLHLERRKRELALDDFYWHEVTTDAVTATKVEIQSSSGLLLTPVQLENIDAELEKALSDHPRPPWGWYFDNGILRYLTVTQARRWTILDPNDALPSNLNERTAKYIDQLLLKSAATQKLEQTYSNEPSRETFSVKTSDSESRPTNFLVAPHCVSSLFSLAFPCERQLFVSNNPDGTIFSSFACITEGILGNAFGLEHEDCNPLSKEFFERDTCPFIKIADDKRDADENVFVIASNAAQLRTMRVTAMDLAGGSKSSKKASTKLYYEPAAQRRAMRVKVMGLVEGSKITEPSQKAGIKPMTESIRGSVVNNIQSVMHTTSIIARATPGLITRSAFLRILLDQGLTMHLDCHAGNGIVKTLLDPGITSSELFNLSIRHGGLGLQDIYLAQYDSVVERVPVILRTFALQSKKSPSLVNNHFSSLAKTGSKTMGGKIEPILQAMEQASGSYGKLHTRVQQSKLKRMVVCESSGYADECPGQGQHSPERGRCSCGSALVEIHMTESQFLQKKFMTISGARLKVDMRDLLEFKKVFTPHRENNDIAAKFEEDSDVDMEFAALCSNDDIAAEFEKDNEEGGDWAGSNDGCTGLDLVVYNGSRLALKGFNAVAAGHLLCSRRFAVKIHEDDDSFVAQLYPDVAEACLKGVSSGIESALNIMKLGNDIECIGAETKAVLWHVSEFKLEEPHITKVHFLEPHDTQTMTVAAAPLGQSAGWLFVTSPNYVSFYRSLTDQFQYTTVGMTQKLTKLPLSEAARVKTDGLHVAVCKAKEGSRSIYCGDFYLEDGITRLFSDSCEGTYFAPRILGNFNFHVEITRNVVKAPLKGRRNVLVRRQFKASWFIYSPLPVTCFHLFEVSLFSVVI